MPRIPPDFESIQRAQSKAEFVRLMQELGLPIPESRIVMSRSELLDHDEFPCFLKLVHSTASLGVQRVSGKEELTETITRFSDRGAWKEGQPIVIQQPASGRQAEVSAAFQEGRLVGIACADVLETGIGGGPALRRTALHAPVVEHVERFGKALNWNGPISIEYFWDYESEQPYYIEANPRIGESFNAQLGGVNLCEASVRIALGEHVERLPDVTPGVTSHNGFIVMIADAFNGAGRLALMRRLWRHWTRRDGIQSEMTRMREDWGSLIPATAVITSLLFSPKSARGLAQGTVDNYSLPQAAAELIDDLPGDFVEEIELILNRCN